MWIINWKNWEVVKNENKRKLKWMRKKRKKVKVNEKKKERKLKWMKKKKKTEVEMMSLIFKIIDVEYIYFVYKFLVVLFLHIEQHTYYLKKFFVHLNNWTIHQFK